MIASKFGDVVLVPFPFTDQSSTKQRPAVVISSAAYHTAKADLILMAVTSQLHQQSSSLEAIISDWKAAGLLKPSVLKPVVFTLEKKLVIKKLGSLAAADRDAVQHIIEQIVGP